MEALTLGFSSCPNDTYIFYGLVKEDPCREYNFQERVEDIEMLNTLVLDGRLDISKVSISAAARVMDRYILLNAGGALGRDCGPVIVSREPLRAEDLPDKRIAIPGRHTTAALLLGIYNPVLMDRAIEMPFNRIMPGIRDGVVDAGVVIHEGRFTYPLYGLHLVEDLGQWWHKRTSLPVPLGGVVGRRELSEELLRTVEECIRQSISLARSGPDGLWEYIRSYAQELSEETIRRHIDTYVNDFTMDLGEEGREAILNLYREAMEYNLIPPISTERVFL